MAKQKIKLSMSKPVVCARLKRLGGFQYRGTKRGSVSPKGIVRRLVFHIFRRSFGSPANNIPHKSRNTIDRIEHAHRRVQALEEYNAQVKTPADRARLLNENPALVAARDEAYQAFKSDQVAQQLEQQQQQQSRSQAI